MYVHQSIYPSILPLHESAQVSLFKNLRVLEKKFCVSQKFAEKQMANSSLTME